ncbi:MAG TPA: hypothetical protein VJC00_03815 [Candidatus Nanoarchaeia archaeon]|nr:hypothetical protein [Candidatus Nanoarchaeia archaeon]
MANGSVFRGALVFLDEIGIYDVVLPFLLVFAVVFAIFEKTKVLGVEKVEGVEYTKKNINAIIAFVIAFLVVASTKLVAAINEAMANVVLLLLVSISFLILIGSFYHYEEKTVLEGAWRKFFMVLMFIIVVLIFLQAIKTDSGDSWLETFWGFLANNWSTNYTASIILLVVVIIMILFITQEKKPSKSGKSEGA